MNPILATTLSKYTTIVLVGWWTGWHIQPIVSLTRHIKNIDRIPSFLWIGWPGSQEEKMAKEENIKFKSIPTLKLATTRSFKILLYPFFLKLGFYRAWRILKWIQDKNMCVFSKGWPGSVAIGIAAWSLSIPLYIHESDTVPWRSNRILGKFASKIFLGFEGAKKYFNSNKCDVIGQILDPVFSSQVASRSIINWETSKPHILVICGSQGSQAIFESIIEQFSDTSEYEWIIALGKLNAGMQSKFSSLGDCQAMEWISQSDIARLIQWTDIAITRWSATTLAELTSYNTTRPHLIIIPLPYSAGNHQYMNALEYEKVGHTLLEQKNIIQLSNLIKNVRNTTENK